MAASDTTVGSTPSTGRGTSHVDRLSITPEAASGAASIAGSRVSESLRIGTAASVVVTGLNRRARHRPERAEHTTIARFWTQDGVATFALVEPLARVRWHCFVLRMPALRACQNRVQEQTCHGFVGVQDDGKPASVVALVRTSTLTLVSSKPTMVSRLAMSDLTPMTPSI